MFSSRKCLYIPHRRDFVYNPPPSHPSGKSNILLSFMHFFNVFWSYSSIPPPRKFHPFCRGERIFSGTEQYRINYDQRTLGNANYNSNVRAQFHTYPDILNLQLFFPDSKISPSTCCQIRCGFLIFNNYSVTMTTCHAISLYKLHLFFCSLDVICSCHDSCHDLT